MEIGKKKYDEKSWGTVPGTFFKKKSQKYKTEKAL